MTQGKRGGIAGIYSIGTNSALKVGLVPMETTIKNPDFGGKEKIFTRTRFRNFNFYHNKQEI